MKQSHDSLDGQETSNQTLAHLFTFSFIDLGGAVSSAHLERIVASLRRVLSRREQAKLMNLATQSSRTPSKESAQGLTENYRASPRATERPHQVQ